MGVKILEACYELTQIWAERISYHVNPLKRRCIRFLALPYCYMKINWEICTRSKIGVILDLLYIFFVLKYYPDNYSPCRLWEKPKSEWKFYYGSIYDPYQRKMLQRKVQPRQYEILFEDKWIADALCKQAGIPVPEVLAKIKVGDNIKDVVNSTFYRFGELSRLIIKPVNGKGGGGILYCEQLESGILFMEGQDEINIDDTSAATDYLIQPFISQHPELTRIAASTNTMRLVTMLLDDGSILVVGAYMRFGRGKSKIDNLSQGGLRVAIDRDSGRLVSTGSDRDGRLYTEHPDSKIAFSEISVPFWKDALELAFKAQEYFDFYYLLGMDIAFGEDGPVLIEINARYDNVGLEQALGPILLNEAVVSAFWDYGLLINRKQKHIAESLRK